MMRPHRLSLSITLFLAMSPAAWAQEDTEAQAMAPQEESAYFAPDWIPGTTELYYGASFHDRELFALVGMAPVVDLGLVEFHSQEVPRGGAEQFGALFFALEEEAQASFPMNLASPPEQDQCPMFMQPAADAVAEDSADADSHRGCEEPARRGTNPILQGVRAGGVPR